VAQQPTTREPDFRLRPKGRAPWTVFRVLGTRAHRADDSARSCTMPTHLAPVLALFLGLFTGGCASSSDFVAAPANHTGEMLWDGAEAKDADGFVSTSPSSGEERRAVETGLAPSAPDPAAPQAERQVIYSASLSLVVVSIAEAQASVLGFAREAGGYLQQSDARSIMVRVPAAKFEEVVARIGRLGEVVDRNVSASDVTEELYDLDIRIENARKARERLLEHLAQSQKIEDTLKIELELTRLTGEIERMEGRKRYLVSQVALSTIHVLLNSTAPQGPQGDGLVVPFEWLARLGDGLVAGTVEGQPRKPRFLAKGPSFDVPAQFLRYYQSEDLVEAMDGDDLRIKVQRQSNYDKGALEFWQKLARRSLVESRALAVGEERALAPDRALVRGTREVAGEQHGYMLVLLRTDKRVFTFEAWGPKARFDAAYPALEASARSLRP
jgi:hypothetical protein